MSSDEIRQEAKSSIALTMNAKGEAQVSVKIYEGTELAELDRIRQIAIAAYKQTASEVR